MLSKRFSVEEEIVRCDQCCGWSSCIVQKYPDCLSEKVGDIDVATTSVDFTSHHVTGVSGRRYSVDYDHGENWSEIDNDIFANGGIAFALGSGYGQEMLATVKVSRLN